MEGKGGIREEMARGILLFRLQAPFRGEHVCSRRWKSVQNELRLKAMLYNKLLGA